MTIPKPLAALRDERARFLTNTDLMRDGFVAGFNAAISALSEASGEFSDKDADDGFDKYAADKDIPDTEEPGSHKDWAYFGYLAGRKDQFEQSAARVGLAEAEVDNFDSICKQLLRDKKSLEARILEMQEQGRLNSQAMNALEARLAERIEWNDKTQHEVHALRNKLAAAELLLESEKRSIKEWNEHTQRTAAAETRCKRLEAELTQLTGPGKTNE